MKTKKETFEVLVAEPGKILAVYYAGEEEPVYYERIAKFLIGEDDIVWEIDQF